MTQSLFRVSFVLSIVAFLAACGTRKDAPVPAATAPVSSGETSQATPLPAVAGGSESAVRPASVPVDSATAPMAGVPEAPVQGAPTGTPPTDPPATLPVAPVTPAGPDDRVVITTEHGRIVLDLFEAEAPRHAANFKKLAREGFYDGLSFHRVQEGFLAQGGDPQGTGRGGPGYTLAPEIGRKHVRGSVGAARLRNEVNPERLSNGSQFTIALLPLPELDGQYTVFGQVIEGMDVVDRLKRGTGPGGAVVPPGSGDRMLRVEVVPAKD